MTSITGVNKIIEVPYVYQAQLIFPKKRKSEMVNVLSYVFLEIDDINYDFSRPIFNIKGEISNAIISRRGERSIFQYYDMNVMQLLKGNYLKYTDRIKALFCDDDEINCFQKMNFFLSMKNLFPDINISNKLVNEDSCLFEKSKNITNNKNIILNNVKNMFKNNIKIINDCFYVLNPIPCLEFNICNSNAKMLSIRSSMKYFIYYENCLNINKKEPSIYYPFYSDLKDKLTLVKKTTHFYDSPFVKENPHNEFENNINNNVLNTYLLKKSFNYYVDFVDKTTNSLLNDKAIYGLTSITKDNPDMKNFFYNIKYISEKTIINFSDLQALKNNFDLLIAKYFPKEYDLLISEEENVKHNNDIFNKIETLFLFFNNINIMFSNDNKTDMKLKNI